MIAVYIPEITFILLKYVDVVVVTIFNIIITSLLLLLLCCVNGRAKLSKTFTFYQTICQRKEKKGNVLAFLAFTVCQCKLTVAGLFVLYRGTGEACHWQKNNKSSPPVGFRCPKTTFQFVSEFLGNDQANHIKSNFRGSNKRLNVNETWELLF